MHHYDHNIVRFDDRLVYHGAYNLSPRAFKTIAYIVSKEIDPYAKNLPEEVVLEVGELARAIHDGKKSNSKYLYNQVDQLCDELTRSRIQFKTDVEINGQLLKGYISWCSSAIAKTENGLKVIRFTFDKNIAQFLLGLSKYVRLYRPEVNRLNSRFAIRLFQILKGDRNRKEKYGGKSVRKFEVDNLKFLLGLEGKYGAFKDFHRYILTPSIDQITEKTTVKITDTKLIKTGRKISHIELHYVGQNDKFIRMISQEEQKDYKPTVEEIKLLSKSEFNAYERLIKFKVKPGIAYKRILPHIQGSESHGFEDFFIKNSIEHFEQWSNNQKTPQMAAATFVKWWTEHKIFDVTSDAWVKINESVIRSKKAIESEFPDVFSNRMIARDMTKEEFENWYQTNHGNYENPIKPTVID